jgi:HSP20 family protein
MVWTPFAKTTTSTAPDQQFDMPNDQMQPMAPPIMSAPPAPVAVHPPQDQMPQPQMHQQQPQGDENWYNESNFEGQLAVDVYQTESDIVIKAPIAGVSPKEIDIAITDDVVTIKGHRKMVENISAEDYYCQECYYGVFSRSIILPVPVVTEQASATFLNGVLTITIAKAANARTKKLEVKAL